jgi:hypothetical protein
MSHTLENAKDELLLLFLILWVIGPYFLLFYKKVGVRIRLLFISLIEMLFFCMLIIGVDFVDENLVSSAYFYELFIGISIPINLIIIFISWIISKIKARAKKL